MVYVLTTTRWRCWHGQDGRHEVGEALAHAGARLGQQVLVVLEGIGHRVGHVELLVGRLVVGQGFGDRPGGAEDLGWGGSRDPACGDRPRRSWRIMCE